MLNFIMIPTILAIIFFTIYGIFELFARRKERITMIEKMSDIKSGDKINLSGFNPFGAVSENRYMALKAGMLITGMGLGLIIGLCIANSIFDDFFNTNYHSNDYVEVIFGAPVLICGGLGLIISFIIELYLNKKEADKTSK